MKASLIFEDDSVLDLVMEFCDIRNIKYIESSTKQPTAKLNKFVKTTVGFVSQTFEKNSNGKFVCTSQEFVAGDQCDYEDEDGDSIDPPEYSYQPYDIHI